MLEAFRILYLLAPPCNARCQLGPTKNGTTKKRFSFTTLLQHLTHRTYSQSLRSSFYPVQTKAVLDLSQDSKFADSIYLSLSLLRYDTRTLEYVLH